ncbi:MAG: hypothetical protein KKE17_00295, partial [Proteobacteria bacterium]|nr:hypothetical protein [Pseudomonadota bacterium]MBU1708421.1 hypothetical protein [Pseudomonadota bacterium]
MNQQEWQTKGAGHRQRLREKYLELGIDAFSDAEVLELILTLGTPRRDCKEIARAVIARFGSLAGALEASEEELQSVKGVGASNGFAIHLVQGVARRYLEKRLAKKEYIRSSGEVADYLIHSMRDLEHEVFKVIFLDAGHGIIATETVAQGTIT